MADIATHIGLLGSTINSELLEEYDEGKDNYKICPSRYPDELRYIIRAAKKLRSCHDLFGIPSHKLHISVRYTLPTLERRNILLRQVHNGILARQGCDRKRQIRVFVASKGRSLAALDLECAKIRLTTRSSVDAHLDHINIIDQFAFKNTTWIARHRELGNQCKEIMSIITSAIREHHKTIIDQVTQLWQDGDEFEEYCLGGFFALAEVW